MIIKAVILIIFLGIATYFDIKEQRIPNLLVITGLIVGFTFMHSINEVIYQLVAIAFLFFFGMLHLMGMGDIKLWMVLAGFVGFTNSCFIVAGAAFLLIVFGVIKNRKEAVLIMKHVKYSLLLKQKPSIIQQTQYAFAPFIFTATLLYLGWRWTV